MRRDDKTGMYFSMLTLAILGRPNVGKSTLFNRLTGKQHALVDDRPGVTRDRREGLAAIGPLEFYVIDTAGLEDAVEGTLAARMTEQSMQAAQDADVLALVVDGRAGITALDAQFAKRLRKQNKPVLLLVNKAEGGKADATIGEAFRLGLGTPIPVSASHGEGLSFIYDELIGRVPKTEDGEQRVEEGRRKSKNSEAREKYAAESQDPVPESQPLHIAILGRPNAGKSTLINALIGSERVLTGPEPGITRDSIALDITYQGTKYKLVDTAGMRRKANISDKLEKMAVGDTLRALRYAEVVVMVIDATAPLEKQDNTIASLIEQEGRAMVLAVNKWDLVEDKPATTKEIERILSIVAPQIRGIPVVNISASKGANLPQLMKACENAYAVWNKRISTGQVNRFLEGMLAEHSPPLVEGRRLKIRYMTQIKARPPTFSLSVNLKEVPEHYLRYLRNGLREAFQLPGVPIRLQLKKGKNPFVDKD